MGWTPPEDKVEKTAWTPPSDKVESVGQGVQPKTNFEQRIQNPEKYITNSDGSVSTHKMMSFESDGKFYAAPTIVEQNGKLTELGDKEAVDYALKNKEYKEFKTDAEAKAYAEGGYKKGTPLENYVPKESVNLRSTGDKKLDILIPYMERAMQKSFSEDPKLFSNEKARTAYKTKIANGYPSHYNEILMSLHEKDPYFMNEVHNQIASSLNPLGETVPDIVSHATEGIEGGVKKIGQTKEVYKKEGLGSAALNAGVGVGSTAFGALGLVVPELMAFNEASQGAGKVDENAAKWLSPATKIIENWYDKNTPEGQEARIPAWVSNLGEVGDFAAYVLAGAGYKGVKQTEVNSKLRAAIQDKPFSEVQELANKGRESLRKEQESKTINHEGYEPVFVPDKKISLNKQSLEQSGAKEIVDESGKLSKALSREEIPSHIEDLKKISTNSKISELPEGSSVNYKGKDGVIKKSEIGEITFKPNEGKEQILGGATDETNLSDKGVILNEGTYSDKFGDYYVEKTDNGYAVYEVRNGKLKPAYENDKANHDRRTAIIRKSLKKYEDSAKLSDLTKQIESLQSDISKSNGAVSESLNSALESLKSEHENIDNHATDSKTDEAIERSVIIELGNFKDELESQSEGLSKVGKEAIKSEIERIDNSIQSIKGVPPEMENGEVSKRRKKKEEIVQSELAQIPEKKSEVTDTPPDEAELKTNNNGKEGSLPETKEGQKENVLTGVKHEDTAKVRENLGLEEYKKTPKTNDELEADADKVMKEGYDIHSLVKKMNEGHLPTDVEQILMRNYLTSLEAKIEKTPTPELISEARKAIEASDKAGSEIGRSLASRKGVREKDETLLDYFMKEEDANQAPLTESQRDNVIKEYNGISEAQKKLEERVAKLEQENTRLRAIKEVSGIKKSGIRRSHADHVAYRQKIAEDISVKLRKIRGEAQSQIVPYAKELIAISPDVAKWVRDYVEEGVYKLEDIAKGIHDNLKDHIKDITIKDIESLIAGNYSEKKTRTDATKTLYELKQQAKLLTKLDALESGVEPKNEKQKIQKNRELEDLRRQIKEHDLTKLSGYKSRVKSQIERIEEDLKTGNLLKEEPKKVQLDSEAKKLRDDYIKLRQERETRILRMQYENRSKREKAFDLAFELANIPRTIMSSMDFSAPLRQSVIATTAHPTFAAKAGLEMFKQAISQKRFDRWFHDVKDDPRYSMSKEAGLFIADPHNPSLSFKEEAFMNNLAEKIPIVGKAIKGSERAYVGFLNKMRWDLFNYFADSFEKNGRTFDNSPKLYKGLADYVNNSTGRGRLLDVKLSKFELNLEQAAPIFNSVFFAPRLIASRVNFLNPIWYARLPKEVRINAIKDMLRFVGVALTVLQLFKLNGANVEDDPHSSDFGKIKSGNTRWDILGGHQQYIRFITQMYSGISKSSNTGKIQVLDGSGPFGRDRGDVATTFFRGKLAPIPSIFADIFAGTTMGHEKTTLKTEAANHLFPLIFQDVSDAMKDKGIEALFTVGIPASFGVGVQTYPPTKHKPKPVKPTEELINQ